MSVRCGSLKFGLFRRRKLSDIEKNLNSIFSEISLGNDRNEPIRLLGATKFVAAERVNEAISCGLRFIGENHAQEFRDKFAFYLPCEKHFIGTLQKNKLKYVVGKADVIDSVSSSDLAAAIDEKASALNVCQKVFIEVNAGDEETKTGASITAAKALYKSIIELKHIKLTGVMTMLPAGKSEAETAELCEKVRAFYDEIRLKTQSVETLSMGMSGDYKIAIKHGSNMIRLGRAIFGEREITTKNI